MMTAENAQPTTKQIENLRSKELDMIYSLVRVGEWTDLEIGRRYRISANDVRQVFHNYSQLREAALRNPIPPTTETTMKKPRKRRSDAKYGTSKERQAAYRRRLRDSRLPIKQPPPAPGIDSEGLNIPDASVTVCPESVIETSPQHGYSETTSDSLREACYGNPGDAADPVTPNASSERQSLRLVEEPQSRESDKPLP